MTNKSDTKKITIVVTPDLYEKIANLADKEDRSMNKQIIRMIEYYFESNK